MNKNNINFKQKIVIALIAVSIPSIITLYIHFDSKEDKQLDYDLAKDKKETNYIEETKIIQDTIAIERRPIIKKEPKHIINKISNKGKIGTIINNNNGEIIINNDLRDDND